MPSENTNILNLVGNVSDATQMSQADGNTPPFTSGRQGDLLTTELHGKAFIANYRGKLFEANVANVILPLTGATLVSVFTLYNPPTSGVNMELTSTLVANVAATTVVNTVGWYYSTATLTSKGGFATAGTVQSGMVGNSPGNKGQFCSAFTHSGTPVLCDIVAGYGATSNTGPGVAYKFYDGQLILPPGIAMSLALSTAVMTGLSLEARWAEWPI
jgi:hypothetical protein